MDPIPSITTCLCVHDHVYGGGEKGGVATGQTTGLLFLLPNIPV